MGSKMEKGADETKEEDSRLKFAPGCDSVVLPYGSIHFRGAFSEKQQAMLASKCMRVASQGGNERLLKRERYVHPDDSKKAVPFCFYQWPGRPEITGITEPMEELLQWGSATFSLGAELAATAEPPRRITRANKQKQQDTSAVATYETTVDPTRFRCPQNFEPNAMYSILYPHDGFFNPHLDGAQGWALSISIGCTATFFYMFGKNGKKHYVTLESGDAMIFNGGALYHGISKVFPGSAPEFWADHEIAVFGMDRLVIQLRDPVRDKLTYNPYFVANQDRNSVHG